MQNPLLLRAKQTALLGSCRLGIVVLLYSLITSLVLAANTPCGDMQACIRAIPTAAAAGDGINHEAQQLAKAINAYGGAAIPGLLPYLKDQRQEVRNLASFILRDQPGLREEHLSALIESRLRGDGWIPNAIARIGTPTAIASLVSALRKEREMGTQLTFAFKHLGPKAGPPLVALYRCDTRCDGKLLEVCASIFGELGDQANAVIPDLNAIALDKTQSLIARRAAVASLGAIGPSAVSTAPDLLKLATTEKADFGLAVDLALLGMRHPAAVDGLLNRIEKGDENAFIRLAELGHTGRGAGPTLVKYLNDPDRAVLAARTLGFIGYEPASEPLVHLLLSDDWRAVYVACESLGQLKVAGTRSELERVTNTHW
jgi:HEAT repeat protein